MRRHPSPAKRAPVLAALLLGIAALGPSRALAQAGAFVDSQPYFLSPIGTVGVEFSGQQIWVDVNGNGLVTPGVDTFHPIPNGLTPAGWDLRLTPSRRVMVAFTSTGAPCPDTPAGIRLYSIPTTNGASFVQLGSQQTLTGCIQDVGFSDDPADPVRTGFFRGPTDGSGFAEILWWDLITGVAATSPFPYQQGFGFIEFAPWGTMAWVQHTINSGAGTNAYSLVDLCPATIGQANQPGLTNQAQVLHAHVEAATPQDAAGTGFVVVARTSGGTQAAAFDYEDCALPPPVTGACCLPGGGCIGGTTQSECETGLAGTWQGASSTCTPSPCPPPPLPDLELTKEGPESVERGGTILYTLTASNTGTDGATGVTVLDSLPGLVQFVFASDGGTFDPGTRRVTWNLGTLGEGDWRILFLTVRAPCAGATTANDNYRISSVEVGPVVGSPAVITTLDAPNTTPLGVALSSTALAPVPLGTGARVRHTVTLTNTLSQERPGVRFNIQSGEASAIVALLDSAGGTFRPLGALIQWEGTLDPLGTKVIRWETEVIECRPSTPAVERINRIGFVGLTARCGQSLGFGSTTQSFAVAGSPFSIRLDTSPMAAQAASGTWYSAARPGATVDFSLRLVHSGTAAAPVCSMATQIPLSMTPVGNPPWIGTPPPGTSWDPVLQVIRWTGVPGPNDSVVVAFRAALGTVECSANLLAAGYHGTCSAALTQALGVVGVAEPPPGAHIVGLDNTRGLYTYIPGAGQWEPLVCGTIGGPNGIGRAPDGSIWLAGNQVVRIHPGNLELQVFPASFNTTLGIDLPFDCDADPRDSSIVFVGYQIGIGLRVRRWTPRTATASFILNDQSPMMFGLGNSVAVGADGFIGVQTQNHLLHIDPANPPGFQAWTNAGANGLGGVALDADGHYLVPENGPTNRRLFKVDRGSGTFTQLADPGPSFSPGYAQSGIAALPGERVYLGVSNGEMVELQRANGNALVARPALLGLYDLLYVDGPTLDAPGPEAEPAALDLLPAAPNPFRSSALLRFTLPAAGNVSLDVFDLVGRRVRSLASGELAAGAHVAVWDGLDQGGHPARAGLYFARLRFGAESRTVRLVRSP